MTTYDKPLPRLTDPTTLPFWEGLREERLALQRCEVCGYVRWPIAPVCPECLTDGGAWTDLSLEGEVWSYVVYHRALNRKFADEVPYVVTLVQLDAGPRIIARLLGDPASAAIGIRVRAAFDPVTPEVTLLRWEPLASGNPLGR